MHELRQQGVDAAGSTQQQRCLPTPLSLSARASSLLSVSVEQVFLTSLSHENLFCTCPSVVVYLWWSGGSLTAPCAPLRPAPQLGVTVQSVANPSVAKQSPSTPPPSSPSSNDDDDGEDGDHVDHDHEVEEDPCFPSTAMVTKADGTLCRIDALKEGDEIVASTADGTLATDTVSLLSIAKPEHSAPMLALRAGNATLTLTPEHHVATGAVCCSELKKAKDVKVGDKVWAVRAGASPLATTVTAKSNTQAKGLHSPVLTHGGFPVVDGIVTSFDTIEKVTLASHGLTALIMACKATGTCAEFKELFVAGERK